MAARADAADPGWSRPAPGRPGRMGERPGRAPPGPRPGWIRGPCRSTSARTLAGGNQARVKSKELGARRVEIVAADGSHRGHGGKGRPWRPRCADRRPQSTRRVEPLNTSRNTGRSRPASRYGEILAQSRVQITDARTRTSLVAVGCRGFAVDACDQASASIGGRSCRAAEGASRASAMQLAGDLGGTKTLWGSSPADKRDSNGLTQMSSRSRFPARRTSSRVLQRRGPIRADDAACSGTWSVTINAISHNVGLDRRDARIRPAPPQRVHLLTQLGQA